MRLLEEVCPKGPSIDAGQPGLIGKDGASAFLTMIEELSDEGLLGCEALVIDTHGPSADQACITHRDCALLRSGDMR